jgi:hypothetical protein
MHARSLLALLAFGLFPSCAARYTVALSAAGGAPPTSPMEITTRSAAVTSPLPLHGSNYAFASIEESVGRVMASAASPWAEQHRAKNPDGWQLLVELWQARAERHGPQITVVMGVRLTLRSRDGNQFIAQTQAHCKQSLLVDPASAAPVFYGCMTQLGRDLGGWLNGIEP